MAVPVLGQTDHIDNTSNSPNENARERTMVCLSWDWVPLD
jgi:hypothetical protein